MCNRWNLPHRYRNPFTSKNTCTTKAANTNTILSMVLKLSNGRQ